MPSDTDIMQTYKKSITEARQFARKMTIVLLSDREKEEEQSEKDKENKDERVRTCHHSSAISRPIFSIFCYKDTGHLQDFS